MGRQRSARADSEKQVMAALPNWVNTISQLNRLIADRMGVTASDLDCLHVLRLHGPATAAELAVRVGLTPGSVSRMIDRLDAAGCVVRTDDPEDGGACSSRPTTTAWTASGITTRA
jgi:DNA-binding MarR family transcriptional regulator